MAILPYMIFLLIFGSIFIFVTQYLFFKEEKKFIKERFVPLHADRGKKRTLVKILLSPLAPINARLGNKSFRQNLAYRIVAAGSPMNVDEFLAYLESSVSRIPDSYEK